MTGTPCPKCNGELDRSVGARGEAYCHDCALPFEVGQCEGCGDRRAEPDMETVNAPGATLWYCPDCATTQGVAYE